LGGGRGGQRRLSGCRGRLSCLCHCRARRCTPSIGAHQILGCDRPLRAEIDGARRRPGPIRLAKEIERFGKPAAVVLVLKYLGRILAPADRERGGADERNTETGAMKRQRLSSTDLSVCPLRHILRQHDRAMQVLIIQWVSDHIGHWLVVHWPSRSTKPGAPGDGQPFFSQRPRSSACQ
jgi:hypothetical protein